MFSFALKHYTRNGDPSAWKCNVCGEVLSKPPGGLPGDGDDGRTDASPFLRHLHAHAIEAAVLPAASKYAKVLLFGGLAGILTTFAIVNAAAGSGLNWRLVLLLGISNATGEGFAMGFGEFVSGSAEQAHVLSERAREEWEVDKFLDVEQQEMVDLYQHRGFSREDATEIVSILAKQRHLFIDNMMVAELGLVARGSKSRTVKQGGAMYAAFLIGAVIPATPYFSGQGAGVDRYYFISMGITAIGLILLGAARGYLTGFSAPISAVVFLLCGVVSGGVSFGLGSAINKTVGGAPPLT
jgi:VIT1/CCC1 family predicted Fe2+/Mn2+ transporter